MVQLQESESPSSAAYSTRLPWLRIWCSISAITLIAATGRIWFPDQEADFPLIPLFEFATAWPLWADWTAAGGLIIGWILFSWTRIYSLGAGIVVVLGVTAIVLDQHRIQPWHYQLLLFCYVFLTAREAYQLRWLRVLIISIYFYSAIGKIDFEFLHTVGPQFVATMGGFFFEQASIEAWNLTLLAFCLPAFELLICVGLAFPATRSLASIGTLLLHLGLVLLLGPAGLDHSWGVVLWNVHFAGLAFLLFFRCETRKPQNANLQTLVPDRLSTLFTKSWMTAIVITPALLLPVGERFGFWDHWPSWALYAPHSSRVEVLVASHRIDEIPQSLRTPTDATSDEAIWTRVSLSKWSLAERGVPVYPQARYQLGVARSLAKQLESEFEIRVSILGCASRLDGKRAIMRLEGESKISGAQNRFLFNTTPRSIEI